MASTKRKQDEKNLKILRELVSQPGNKECFDCHQRGPTYVNMTIGSFVCTSCSGLLRGLTPPHRVKSISMATFTAAEINFITQRGNEYCKGIWLGSMNPGDSQPLDTKDEQKIKDLMIAKYELKRYYLEPPSEDRNQRPSQKTETLTKSSISRVPLPIMSTLSNSKTNITETKNLNDVTGNFIADFSKAPESCLTPATVDSKLGSSGMMQASFANFDNNPAFSASANTPLVQMSLHHNTGTPAVLHMNETSTAPSEDRYAALKDLDFLMKQTQLKDEATTTEKSSNAWNTNNSNLSNTVWGTGNQSRDVINNPFSNIDIWPTSTNLFNNNFYPDTALTNSVNPFKSEQNSVNIAGTNVPDSQWTGTQPPNLTNVIQYNQLRTPFVNKVWQPTVPSYHANPFLVGTGMNNVTNNSNNPFL